MADAQIKVGIKADQTRFVAGTKKAGEAIDTLKKKADEYNKGFEDAAKQSQKEIDRLTARLKKAGGATSGFGDIIKSVAGGAVAGFAAGLVSADAVVAGFKKTIASTQATSDAWGVMMSEMKYSADYFFQSLAEWNFDGFIEGLDIAISKGRELAQQLDNLGDMKFAGNLMRSKMEGAIEDAKLIINSDKSTPEEKKKANEDLKRMQSEYKSYMGRLSEQSKASALALAGAVTGMDLTMQDIENYIKNQQHDPDDPYQKYIDRKNAIKEAHKTDKSGQYALSSVVSIISPLAGPLINAIPMSGVTEKGAEELKKIANPAFDRLEMIVNRIMDGDAGEREKLEQLLNEAQEYLNESKRYENKGIRLDNRAGRAATVGGRSGGKIGKTDFWDSVEAPDARELGLDKPMVAPIRAALIVAPEVIKRLEEERRSLAEQLNATVDPEARVKLKAEISDVEGKLGQVRELTEVDGLKIPEPPGTEDWNTDGLDKMIGTFGDLANVMDLVTGSSDNALSSVLRWGAGIVSAIGQAIPSILALTAASKAKATAQAKEAVTGAAASKSFIPFAGPLMAVAAIASVVAAIAGAPKFAGGGIVPGTSFGGGKVLARLNSGEMVLNKAQQARLFSRLNSADSAGGGRVEFKIKGEELVGVLDRFGRRSSRT